jgi:hypothetical protein
MTGGVASLVERFASPDVRARLLPRLTARRFEDAWDGAMFMTERSGGSDLGTLTTVARQRDGGWRLDGAKWFCSNVDAAAIATLARPEGAPEGIKGVALFVVPRWRTDGSPNGIRIQRLKDKLGTRTVPTGEVDFVDAEAFLLGGGDAGTANGGARDGRGINRMMRMVNASRFGVACMGLGIMRRAFLESAIYAARREAFGRRLHDLPLVRATLLGMLVDLEAAAALVFAAAHAIDARASALARLLTPLAKFRASRQGLELASLAVEMHGGNGYVEDWPTARLLREAQCHTIWEGTENVICLDVLRALRSEGTAHVLLERVRAAAEGVEPAIAPVARAVVDAAARTERQVAATAGRERTSAEYRARGLTARLCDVTQAALLLEEARWELATRGSARKAVVATLFVARRLLADEEQRLALEEAACQTVFDPLLRYGTIAPGDATLRLDARA